MYNVALTSDQSSVEYSTDVNFFLCVCMFYQLEDGKFGGNPLRLVACVPTV